MHSIDWHMLWYNLHHLGAPDSSVSILEKVFRPFVVYLLLVFALRTVGKRMLAQLNPFDFVVLLTLSNTVQNAIIGNDTSLLGGIAGAAALLGTNAFLVRIFYRGPSRKLLWDTDKDIALMKNGQLDETTMRKLHINAGELSAKAHERGFDSLDDVDSIILYPNGTMYFKAKPMASDTDRFQEIIRRLDDMSLQLSALRR